MMSATVHPARVWPAGPGRSAFWINWQGGMTPCGMMTQPLFSVPELGFAQAWERTRAATERIRLPGPARAAG